MPSGAHLLHSRGGTATPWRLAPRALTLATKGKNELLVVVPLE
jgi:hypothetical protein